MRKLLNQSAAGRNGSALDGIQRIEKFGVHVSSAANVAQLVARLGEAAAESLGAAEVTLCTVSGIGDRVSIIQARGNTSMAEEFATVPLDLDMPAATAIRQGHPIYFHSGDAFAQRHPQWVAMTEARASLAFLPLRSAQGVYGCLGLSFAQPQPFDESQRLLLAAAAQVTATAYERTHALDQLQGSRDLFALTLENIEDAILVQDTAFRVVYANAAAARIFGVRRGADLLRLDENQLLANLRILDENGHDLLDTQLPVRKALRGERLSAIPVRLRFESSGEERWSLLGATPLVDANGTVQYAVNVFRDITALKRAQEDLQRMNQELEDRVQRRTEDLRAAVSELESFNYSVSHDLRTPLRGIRGFATLLSEEKSSRLDDQGRIYLGFILGATTQMSQTIEALLRLSKVAAAHPKRETIDLGDMANAIFQQLRERDPHRDVQLRLAPNLTAYADATLARIALENLIQNSWKFTRGRSTATIEVGRHDAPGEPTFYVRDNGIGFDMTESHLLFRAFRRLSTASGYSGSGVGLATVRRIAERHGGRAWGEGERGNGATFYVSFGDAKPPRPTAATPLVSTA